MHPKASRLKSSGPSGAAPLLPVAMRAIAALLLSPVIFVLLLPLLALRLCACVLMWCRYGKKMSPLGGLDSVWGSDSDAARSIIHSFLVMEGTCDLERIRRVVRVRFLDKCDPKGRVAFPRVFQYATRFMGFWFVIEADTCDLDFHIRILDGVNEDQLLKETHCLQLLSDIANRNFDPDRAPWEMLIIPRFAYDHEDIDAPHKYAIMLRTHHTMADGTSLIHAVLGSVSDHPMCTPPINLPKLSLAQRMGITLLTLGHLPRAIFKPFHVSHANPLYGSQLSGRKQLCWSPKFDFSIVKDIKNRAGCTVTDVLLSTLSGCIAEKFQECDSTIPPCEISAVVPVPVLIPKGGKVNAHVRNQVIFVDIPMDVSPDKSITQRLRFARKHSHRSRPGPGAFAHWWFLQGISAVYPSSKLKGYPSGTTLAVSNVPGPQEPLWMWGDRLLDAMFWVPTQDRTGLGASILSYNGRIRLGFIVDEHTIRNRSQIDSLLKGWQAQIHELEATVFDSAPLVSIGLTSDVKTVPV